MVTEVNNIVGSIQSIINGVRSKLGNEFIQQSMTNKDKTIICMALEHGIKEKIKGKK